MQYLHQLILSQLSTLGRVDIKDVGTLEVQSHPATIDRTKNLINPPFTSIEFDRNKPQIESFSLGQDELAAAIWAAIQERNDYIIEDVGSFSKEADYLIFRQNDDSPLVRGGHRFSSIQFIPVRRVDQIAANPSVDIFKPSITKRKFKWRKLAFAAVALLILFNVGLFGIATFKKYGMYKFESMKVNLPDGRVNVKPSEQFTLPDLPEIPLDSVSEAELNPEDFELDSDNTLDALIEEPIEIVKEETKVESAPKISERPIAKSPNAEVESKTLSTLKDLNQRGKDCAIIIGSFSKQSNVDNLKKVLQADGFIIYEDQHNSMTRVGIFIPCQEQMPGLKLARKNLQPDAWLMQVN